MLSTREMKDLEAKAFASGASPESLMEEAGLEMSHAIRQFFPAPGRVKVFYGKGHNGGDALVAARHLAAAGWNAECRTAYADDQLSELTRRKLSEFERQGSGPAAGAQSRLILLDGLLGIGVAGALREPIRGLAREINSLRSKRGAFVFAVDLPTGLDSDTGEADPDCVRADATLTVGAVKAGFAADTAPDFVGRLCLLPVEALADPHPEAGTFSTPRSLAGLVKPRDYESNKGDYGRIGIVAGSRGFTGAAVLSATGALKAGAGLVTLHVTEDIYSIVASAVPPEIMVHPVRSLGEALEMKRDVLAIGPGLGKQRADEALALIRDCPEPMVVDADALNILSTAPDRLADCAGPRLLTPHPGEMARLFETKGKTRREIATAFTSRYPVTLLLKGSRTIVAEKSRPVSYNTTGNPGMSTGGMGDVLTGVCAAMLGAGHAPYDAGRLGAWVCGRAAEIAIFEGGESEESLSAGDLFGTLGRAFRDLGEGCY